MMELGDNSVFEECAMICTDIYSDDEGEEIVVYETKELAQDNMKKRHMWS